MIETRFQACTSADVTRTGLQNCTKNLALDHSLRLTKRCNELIFPPFMEPEGSLPLSKKSATKPYLEQVKSSPHLRSVFL